MRNLVVDTATPGTEIFVINTKGHVIERGIRKLEKELPVALYKIRYRIGDRVIDSLIELTPGQGDFPAPIPQLPIVSAAPSLRTDREADRVTQLAMELSNGPRRRLGTGGSLFIFVCADRRSGASEAPAKPSAGLSLHRFSGELLVDMAEASTVEGCSGCSAEIDPGQYLLRAKLDAGPAIEQTVTVAQGWQTGVYLNLIETREPSSGSAPDGTPSPRPTWEFDLQELGIVIVRDHASAALAVDDVRWTAAARQALAAGRGDAAPNRELLQSFLQGKFENPMFGIYAGHLLALQPQPDREILREVYTTLSKLIGPQPDVDALLIALKDPRGEGLTFPEPPMLRASWSLVLRGSTAEHDLRPQRSYSSRIAGSLWGCGAWLSWRTPPPETPHGEDSPDFLQALIKEAADGGLDARLGTLKQVDLTAAERLLVINLLAAGKRLQFANELTAEDDNSTFLGRHLLPILRHFVDSDVQRQTKEKIAGDLSPSGLSSFSGIPYSTLVEAASSLGRKLDL